MAEYTLPQDDIDFIKNLLRQGSVKWQGRAECLRRARKRVMVRRSKTGQPIYKYHWQCASCRRWTKNEKLMEVDHIIEIGSFNGDWNLYVPRVFCGQDNLQALCVVCHLKKTKKFNSARTRWKRKR